MGAENVQLRQTVGNMSIAASRRGFAPFRPWRFAFRLQQVFPQLEFNMSKADLPPKPQFEGHSGSPDDVLPQVEPPSAGFILQLFFIPLVIVTIVIMVWLMFSWIAQAGSDPRDLVDNLRRLNDSSWQSALSLAEQLKNPEYDHLKDDHGLAKDLADVLSGELKMGSVEESRLRLRIFLCRSLGEFRVADGIEALVQGATQENRPEEINVRAAAVEALAVMASNPEVVRIREDPQVLEALSSASQSRREGDDSNHLAAELRSRAAYALGVYGGDVALDRLVVMLDDAYPNVRYNSATGLARNGDFRATSALLDMLDPKSQNGMVDEQSAGEKQRKRSQILLNGVRAAFQLLQHPAAAEADESQVQKLETALETLKADGEFPAANAAAADALQRLAPVTAK